MAEEPDAEIIPETPERNVRRRISPEPVVREPVVSEPVGHQFQAREKGHRRVRPEITTGWKAIRPRRKI